MLSVAGRGNENVQLMKSLESVAASVSVLVFFLVSPPAPAAALLAISNSQLPPGSEGGGSVVPQAPQPSQAPMTGVFCIEEMTATFCNVVTGPNINGHAHRIGIERRSRRQHIVVTALPGTSAVQRIMRLK